MRRQRSADHLRRATAMTHECPTQTIPPRLLTSSTAFSTPLTSGAIVNILRLSSPSSSSSSTPRPYTRSNVFHPPSHVSKLVGGWHPGLPGERKGPSAWKPSEEAPVLKR